jgi:excinuclease ABC subunit C
MGRCLGACAGLVTRERYLPVVDDAVRFLRGEYRGLLARWKTEMNALSGGMRFEEAAKVRDRIAVVSRTLARQRVVRNVGGDVDAVGWHRDGASVSAVVLYVRNGRLTDAHQRHFRWEGPEEEAIDSFLLHHYGVDAFFPGEILLPFPVADRAALSAALSERAGRPVAVRVPLRGERFRLVDLARRNAAEGSRMRREKEEAYERLAERMAVLFSLPGPPARIEGYDISNLSGTEAVGSMVTFLGGKPAKKWYRKFSVRGVVGQDDFAMMEEVIGRRFTHDEDFGGMPDLVLIDGGKGQLSSAAAAMRAAGREDVPLLALAKERVRGGEKIFRERVFLPGRKNPLHLPFNDPVLHLLMRVRDEAHRFAVTFHRVRRSRRVLGPPAE